MKIVLFLFVIFSSKIGTQAWFPVKNPFQLKIAELKQHSITDCMDVRSDEGIYKYTKTIDYNSEKNHSNFIDVSEVADSMRVCGLYLFTDPDKIIEIFIRQLDVDCEFGGLVSVFDGWELNGNYFPNQHDHPLNLEQRSNELCNTWNHYPLYKSVYRSSQNAALIQYRIPVKGSFTVIVRHLKNPQPCNILVQPELSPSYYLSNYGERKNCSISSMFPAKIKLIHFNVGGKQLQHDCDTKADRLAIEGVMEANADSPKTLANICGKSNQMLTYSMLCDFSTLRLISSGLYQNRVLLSFDFNSFDEELVHDTLYCET
ncbi:corticotropin-releasing factor-binding protein [Culicoides brevitarsis]|uniref:corticotropin-releasing factor-binding protein n=1 Tax=Culicoides brevitarsis TaxID=469753 RepID=UPI00307CAE2F